MVISFKCPLCLGSNLFEQITNDYHCNDCYYVWGGIMETTKTIEYEKCQQCDALVYATSDNPPRFIYQFCGNNDGYEDNDSCPSCGAS